MKFQLCLALVLMLIMMGALVAVPTAALRADEKNAKDTSGDKSKDAKDDTKNDDDDDSVRGKVVFKPPTAGAPAARTGGASRGPAVPRIWVYSPVETGLTVSAKPKFYWYQDSPSNAKLILTVIGVEDEKPLLQVTLSGSRNRGVYAFDMGSQSAELAPGSEYKWSVRLAVDPKEPSNDPFSEGWVKRINTSDELKASLASARKSEIAEIYAGNGIWYDALGDLGDRIDSNPAGKVRGLRANLLDQVLLKDAAEFERSQVGKK